MRRFKRRVPDEVNHLLAPRLLAGQPWQVGEWVWLWVSEFGILLDGVLAQVTLVKRGRAQVDLLPEVWFAADGRGVAKSEAGCIRPLRDSTESEFAFCAHRELRAITFYEQNGQAQWVTEAARALLQRRSVERAVLLAERCESYSVGIAQMPE